MTGQEPGDAELAARYGPRIAAELRELSGTSEVTHVDRRPVTLDQQSVGRLSRMDAMQRQAMAAAVPARRSQRRLALEAAERRMRMREFGWCANCGEYIGTARLDIDPAVLVCVNCARRS